MEWFLFAVAGVTVGGLSWYIGGKIRNKLWWKDRHHFLCSRLQGKDYCDCGEEDYP